MDFKTNLNKILESASFNWSKEKKAAGIEKAASLITKYPKHVTLNTFDQFGNRKSKIFKGAFGLAQILGLHPMTAFIETKTEIDPKTGEEVEVDKPLKIIPVIPSYIKNGPISDEDQVKLIVKDEIVSQLEKILKEYGVEYIKDFQSRYDVGLASKDQKVHGTQFRLKIAMQPAPIEVGEPETSGKETPQPKAKASKEVGGSISDAKKRLAQLMKSKSTEPDETTEY